MSIINIGGDVIKNLPKVSSVSSSDNFTLNLDEIVDKTLKASKLRKELIESKNTIDKEYNCIKNIVWFLPWKFSFSSTKHLSVVNISIPKLGKRGFPVIKFTYNKEDVDKEVDKKKDNVIYSYDIVNGSKTYYQLLSPDKILKAALYKFYEDMSTAKHIAGSVFFYAGSKKEYSACMGGSKCPEWRKKVN